MINLKDINKVYRQGDNLIPIIKGINLEIEKGEFISIMGSSGSGKTTLLNIIGCLDQSPSGEYILEGIDVLNTSERTLTAIRNRKIGFVFQHFLLLPRLTTIENVELPLIYGGYKKKERREIAYDSLEKVGLKDKVDYYPNQLSGGQKQRVAIARAISSSPEIIVADEPTGALDSKSSKQIMGIFRELNKEGKTIVMVTHEEEVANYSFRRIVLNDGEIKTDRRIIL
ncbi:MULTISPECIES: ABC transporter ATP-binding protein [Exiguobacterium]|uniref:ABC transporter ATP-binding protein n=1 Tax=Exiguobacterium TaxID=33986 RepID=UPI0025C220B5|nr:MULTISPECIES: ABC transporter ATP-binding protein [Exiguobacterium]